MYKKDNEQFSFHAADYSYYIHAVWMDVMMGRRMYGRNATYLISYKER